MISARTLGEDETSGLIDETEPPPETDERMLASLPAELSVEDFLQVEAPDLLAEYDRVELPKQRATHPFSVFLSLFWGPIPWLIESSAVVSAVARRWEISGIILILLLVDAYLGFWQEYQSGNIIRTFKEMLP